MLIMEYHANSEKIIQTPENKALARQLIMESRLGTGGKE